jgi:hypothetical protein
MRELVRLVVSQKVANRRRRKKEEGRMKKEEGRTKKEDGSSRNRMEQISADCFKIQQIASKLLQNEADCRRMQK